MGWLVQSINSSIGKKVIMALTGTLLLLFLMYHFAGNLTLYFGREVFTTYVETHCKSYRSYFGSYILIPYLLWNMAMDTKQESKTR